MQNPIVVTVDGNERRFIQGTRQAVPIGEPEIKEIAERFIRARYEWNALDPKMISRTLEPLTTSGLNRKLKNFLVELRDKGLQGKKASQTVAGITVTVTEKEIIAHFDKVLRVEGIPLIVPTGISLNVVKGSQTHWNPSGVYINGVIENASK